MLIRTTTEASDWGQVWAVPCMWPGEQKALVWYWTVSLRWSCLERCKCTWDKHATRDHHENPCLFTGLKASLKNTPEGGHINSWNHTKIPVCVQVWRSFLRIFLRDITSGHEIKSEVGFCVNMGPFLISWVMRGHEIDSVWTAVLCLTKSCLTTPFSSVVHSSTGVHDLLATAQSF